MTGVERLTISILVVLGFGVLFYGVLFYGVYWLMEKYQARKQSKQAEPILRDLPLPVQIPNVKTEMAYDRYILALDNLEKAKHEYMMLLTPVKKRPLVKPVKKSHCYDHDTVLENILAGKGIPPLPYLEPMPPLPTKIENEPIRLFKKKRDD